VLIGGVLVSCVLAFNPRLW